MNFLQLCQRVRQESGGVAGSTTTPATVVGQTGQLADIVNWVRDSWRDLQQKHRDWLFMRSSFTLALSASDNDYADSDCTPPITDLGTWDDETFRIYLTSAGVSDETFLTRQEYAIWRDVWNIGAQTPSRPGNVVVKPNFHLGFGPVPDASYTVTGEYLRSAQELAVDADEPTGLPSEFHMIIVYRALQKYAGKEGAPEVYAIHHMEHRRMEDKLEQRWLPQWRTGAPMA